MKVKTREQQIIVDFWAAVDMGSKQKKQVIHAEGYRAEMHIPYIPDYNEDHMLNLYYPKDYYYKNHDSESIGGDKLPTIINIHGGGWMFSHLDDSHDYMAQLAARGYAVMGMGYQLVPKVDVRTIVQEIYCSMHWLEQYGEQRGFDLSKVLLTGDSAGGHLALLVACIQASEALQTIYGVAPVHFPITTVGISCPCPDTNELYIVPSGNPEDTQRMSLAYKELLLGEQGLAAINSRALSFWETLGFVRDLSQFPPIYLIGSENEFLHYQTQTLLRQLQEKNLRHETLIWKKEDGQHLMHVFNVEHWDWYEGRLTNDRMLEYFRKCYENA